MPMPSSFTLISQDFSTDPSTIWSKLTTIFEFTGENFIAFESKFTMIC